MTSIADTLRAIEARAGRAIVQELRLMTQEILAMRTALVLEERSYADALLLKLDHLAQEQTVVPATAQDAPALLMPSLRFEDAPLLEPMTYKISFLDRASGDLEDVVTLDTLEASVQLVSDRLDTRGGYVVVADWTKDRGSLKVLTPAGMVLASIDEVQVAEVTVHPFIAKVHHALQSGDTSRIRQLFGLMPKAA